MLPAARTAASSALERVQILVALALDVTELVVDIRVVV
jgi:hypothetical protein